MNGEQHTYRFPDWNFDIKGYQAHLLNMLSDEGIVFDVEDWLWTFLDQVEFMREKMGLNDLINPSHPIRDSSIFHVKSTNILHGLDHVTTSQKDAIHAVINTITRKNIPIDSVTIDDGSILFLSCGKTLFRVSLIECEPNKESGSRIDKTLASLVWIDETDLKHEMEADSVDRIDRSISALDGISNAIVGGFYARDPALDETGSAIAYPLTYTLTSYRNAFQALVKYCTSHNLKNGKAQEIMAKMMGFESWNHLSTAANQSDSHAIWAFTDYRSDGDGEHRAFYNTPGQVLARLIEEIPNRELVIEFFFDDSTMSMTIDDVASGVIDYLPEQKIGDGAISGDIDISNPASIAAAIHCSDNFSTRVLKYDAMLGNKVLFEKRGWVFLQAGSSAHEIIVRRFNDSMTDLIENKYFGYPPSLRRSDDGIGWDIIKRMDDKPTMTIRGLSEDDILTVSAKGMLQIIGGL